MTTILGAYLYGYSKKARQQSTIVENDGTRGHGEEFYSTLGYLLKVIFHGLALGIGPTSLPFQDGWQIDLLSCSKCSIWTFELPNSRVILSG